MTDIITIEECVSRLDAIRHEIVSNSRDHFALSAGIAALYELESSHTANRWISCAEQLPKRETDVLVYIPVWVDNPIQVAHLMYDGITWELSDGEFNFGKREVLYWMPLPEIPEQPEKE